jgi:hypothetical protein
VGGAFVDADEASFGHSVVEVEVMCETEEEVCVEWKRGKGGGEEGQEREGRGS